MTDSAPAEEQAQTTTRNDFRSTITLVVGTVVFIALLCGIAVTNVRIAGHESETLIDINLAARQGMLAERMAKDLVQIQDARRAHQNSKPQEAELQGAASLFDSTQAALIKGGVTKTALGASLKVDALSQSEQRILSQADQQWVSLSEKISRVASTPGDLGALNEATRLSLTVSPQISLLMDQLGAEIVKSSDQDTTGLNNLRNLLTGFAVGTFLVIVFIFYMRAGESSKQLAVYAESLIKRNQEVEESSRQLAEAKSGADLIMDTVRQGLFLIDVKHRIQGQYSREVEQIFRIQDLSGYNFLNILQRLLTERMFNTSRDYLTLLFDKTKKERTVLKVNPLDEVEVNFANPEGGFISKFLNFSFRRIVENGEITRIFVAVSDVTERVQLERQLRESEQRKERQFEFLLGVLHVEPKQLDDFLQTAREQVAVMNDALRAQDFAAASAGQMDLLRQRLDVVYRSIHTVKGNAAMLKLQYFQKFCDQFEGKILDLKHRMALGGDDFLSVVIAQSELRQDLDELQELRQKFVGGHFGAALPGLGGAPGATSGASSAPAVQDQDDLVLALSSLANQIAGKQGKEVHFDAAGFDSRSLADDKRRLVKDVLIQLTRNSLTHGIEEARLREVLGKPRAGTITLRRLPNTEAFTFTFRDDGRGLDPTRIRESAVAKGIVTPEVAAAMEEGQLVGLIFHPGFSTAEEITTDAGRGIGMNVIKEAVIDRCGGEIGVNSEPAHFTEFSFVIPVTGSQTPPPPQYAHS